VWSQLSKARLSALVLLTTAVGYVVAPWPTGAEGWWPRLLWTCLGTGMAAASAAMLNQVAEKRRDALMRRTAGRPLPAGHARQTELVSAVPAAAWNVLAGHSAQGMQTVDAGVLE
jgi:heme O synthase-like polyprenyltransferase